MFRKRGTGMSINNAVSARPSAWGMGGKILVKVLLADFCCLVLVVSTIFFFTYQWLLWVMELICVSILIAFIASPVNNRGHRDRGYYERNNLKPDKLYGLKAGLIAAFPFYVMTILAIFMTLGILPDYFFFYRVFNSFFWPFISIVVSTVGVYDFTWYFYVIFFLMISIIPVTCHIAYTLGFKDIVISDRIVYKKNKKEK